MASVDRDFFDLITESFTRSVGQTLVSSDQTPEWLYNDAPFALVAHNTDPDPLFIYANVTAQRQFGYSWTEFIGLPSRLSAGPAERGERQMLLEAVTKFGFMKGYRGLRVTKSGRRFWMEDGIVWQLIDLEGRNRGQAAVFSKWTAVEELK